MEVYLKIQKIDVDHFRDGRRRLSLLFQDERSSTEYRWVPRWEDIEDIFFRAFAVELLNNPESPYLIRFADAARPVANHVPESAGRVGVSRYRVRSGQLDTMVTAESSKEAAKLALKRGFQKGVEGVALIAMASKIVQDPKSRRDVEMHGVIYSTEKILDELGIPYRRTS